MGKIVYNTKEITKPFEPYNDGKKVLSVSYGQDMCTLLVQLNLDLAHLQAGVNFTGTEPHGKVHLGALSHSTLTMTTGTDGSLSNGDKVTITVTPKTGYGLGTTPSTFEATVSGLGLEQFKWSVTGIYQGKTAPTLPAGVSVTSTEVLYSTTFTGAKNGDGLSPPAGGTNCSQYAQYKWTCKGTTHKTATGESKYHISGTYSGHTAPTLPTGVTATKI